MLTRLRCPRCDKYYEFSVQANGKDYWCPICRERLVVLGNSCVSNDVDEVAPVGSGDIGGGLAPTAAVENPQLAVTAPGVVGRPDTTCVSQVRPWVRYFARMIDVVLGGVAFGFILALIYPAGLLWHDAIFGITALFFLVFLEAFFLSALGSTPGKWLLRIAVRDGSGRKLTFSQALLRAFRVWWRGLGAGIPLVSLITLLAAHNQLKKRGITTWDQDGGIQVSHKKIGLVRVTVVLLLFGGCVYVVAMGRVDQASPEEEILNLVKQGRGNVPLPYAPAHALNEFWEDMRVRMSSMHSQQTAEIATSAIAKGFTDSVVSIEVRDANGELVGQGSGVMVGGKGGVLTNRHVVIEGKRFLIRSRTGWSCAAPSLVADYPEADIVILLAQVPAYGLRPAPTGNSDALQPGNRVVAIGNPMGFEGTISEGIVGAIRGPVGSSELRLFQITAPISPGSSGGALFNSYGQLVGITTLASKGSAQNVNFAVPINHILRDTVAISSGAQAVGLDRPRSNSGGDISPPPQAPPVESVVRKVRPPIVDVVPPADVSKPLGAESNEARSSMPIRNQPALPERNGLEQNSADVDFEAYRKFEMYKKLAQENPDSSEAHYLLGMMCARRGLYSLAVNAYEDAVRLNPNDVLTHYNLGLAYKATGDKQQARREFEEVKRLNPAFARECNLD